MALKHICIFTLIGLLPSALLAKPSYSFKDSIMMPGSRLVAGDLTKNEFYILSEGEAAPRKPVAIAQKESNRTKQNIPQIKIALKQALEKKKTKRDITLTSKTAFKQKTYIPVIFIPVVRQYQPSTKTPANQTASQKLETKKELYASHTCTHFGKKRAIKQLAAVTAKQANYKVTKVKNKPKVKVVTKLGPKQLARSSRALHKINSKQV